MVPNVFSSWSRGGVTALCIGVLAPGCSDAARTQVQAAETVQAVRCASNQLLGVSTKADEVTAHRQFELPVVDYPSGTNMGLWGIPLTLLVDVSGRVVCYETEDSVGRSIEMNSLRHGLIRALSDWRYQPFMRDGRAVAAVVREHVYEQALPKSHRAMPNVPLDQVTISLWRTGCYGTCPSYGVRIHGDGTVLYEGRGYVDVIGRHTYRIPMEQVAALVEDLRRKDLWSMDGSYRAGITDNPTYALKLQMGSQAHEIEDYVGAMVGMPRVISEFEDEVDRVGRTADWTRLSMASVERLQQEGFDFHSKQGADLLVRALANDDGNDEQAMLKLVELGVPLTGGSNSGRMMPVAERPILEQALVNHRVALVDPLIARGMLETNGRPDQHKIDSAFQAAIRGGRLAAVQKIWRQSGTRKHPSLFFVDEVKDEDKHTRKKSPVSLLLSQPYRDKQWEGMQIAKWLSGLGCDLRARAANGDTLLHAAVDSGDIQFVRYLLAQGVDVSAPGEYDLPALGSAQNEDIALLLLQSGSDWKMDDDGAGFKRYATDQHWGRVLAWLKANGGNK